MFLFSCVGPKAPDAVNEYFIGKWDVNIKGTPGGDSKLIVNLKIQEGEVSGTVTKEDGIVKISEIKERGDSLILQFKHRMFNVDLLMKKLDKNHCSCKLVDMFEGSSIRIDSKVKN